MRKLVLFALMAMVSTAVFARPVLQKLVLAGPESSVTHPMTYMVEAGLLNDVAEEVKLVTWKNPDQLRALIASGQVDFTAAPSHVAALLYNKGIPLKLMNIANWGILGIVSTDPTVKTLTDLKGEELVMTFRGDFPDLVLSYLAEQQQLVPGRDFKRRYVPNFPAVAAEVISGRAKHALLVEPLVSMSLVRARFTKGAPKLYKAIDLQNEWGKVKHTENKIATAGICALPRMTKQKAVVAAVDKAYRKALQWAQAHPRQAAEIVVKYIPSLKLPCTALGLQNKRLEVVEAQSAKVKVIEYLTVLKNLNPAKIGGKLPDDNFYWAN